MTTIIITIIIIIIIMSAAVTSNARSTLEIKLFLYSTCLSYSLRGKNQSVDRRWATLQKEEARSEEVIEGRRKRRS